MNMILVFNKHGGTLHCSHYKYIVIHTCLHIKTNVKLYKFDHFFILPLLKSVFQASVLMALVINGIHLVSLISCILLILDTRTDSLAVCSSQPNLTEMCWSNSFYFFLLLLHQENCFYFVRHFFFFPHFHNASIQRLLVSTATTN